jgi:hypothetical protein
LEGKTKVVKPSLTLRQQFLSLLAKEIEMAAQRLRASDDNLEIEDIIRFIELQASFIREIYQSDQFRRKSSGIKKHHRGSRHAAVINSSSFTTSRAVLRHAPGRLSASASLDVGSGPESGGQDQE